nr:immunoglobulin light chain junction region [Macaca mulatta]
CCSYAGIYTNYNF